MWGGLKDEEIAAELSAPSAVLREKLLELGERAIIRTGHGSDNTSAAALRWLGD
jgi:hypothetical protein